MGSLNEIKLEKYSAAYLSAMEEVCHPLAKIRHPLAKIRHRLSAEFSALGAEFSPVGAEFLDSKLLPSLTNKQHSTSLVLFHLAISCWVKVH